MTLAGVVVATINGPSTNTVLGIPTTMGNDNLKLSDKMRCKLRLVYSELDAVIIDEVSKISNINLYKTYCELCEIFSDYNSFRKLVSIAPCSGKIKCTFS